jgi:hypothetical protein
VLDRAKLDHGRFRGIWVVDDHVQVHLPRGSA